MQQTQPQTMRTITIEFQEEHLQNLWNILMQVSMPAAVTRPIFAAIEPAWEEQKAVHQRQAEALAKLRETAQKKVAPPKPAAPSENAPGLN